MAAVLKLLQTVDPKTRQYIRYYKISEIYEVKYRRPDFVFIEKSKQCLLSGISVVRPDDCIGWLIEKLEIMQTVGVKEIKWDMFIPENLKPEQKPVDETALSYVFNFLDEMLDPSNDMIEKAYKFYNKQLLKKIFFSWLRYHLMKKYERQKYERKLKAAVLYHRHKFCKFFFNEWLNWTRFRKDRQQVAQLKLTRLLKITHFRTIMDQWNMATKDARKTREYFERLERGENVDDHEMIPTNGEARDDISALPRNAAIKIFSYLSVVDLLHCSEVCRSWKMITNSNVLWSKVDLYCVKDILSDKVLAKIIHKCRPYCLHLNVRGSLMLTKSGIASISGCRNIQDLNLSDLRNLTDELVNVITTGCHILLYLNLSFNDNITDSTIRCLAKNCINLQYLSMSFCMKITDRGFMYLAHASGLKKLIFIDVSGCDQISPTGYQLLAQHCKNLEHFVVNDYASLTDRHVKVIALTAVKLTSVTIMDSPFLTDESFRYLSTAKNLKKIKVSSNHTITDSAFKALTRNCSELRVIYITDCPHITDATLKCLSTCKNLVTLNVADCIRISDIGLKLLADGVNAPKLRELNFTNCIRVSNPGFIAIARKCKSITYLSICFCEQIEEDGLGYISQMDTLISVDLSGCKCGDHSLKDIGSGGRLRHASFSGCKEITDLGLQKFCTQCPTLESLDLSYCAQLTDNSIKSLAFCCKLIRHLNLCACALLTDMSMQYLSGVCTYLETLDVSYCQSITDKGMKYLKKGCRHLRKLVIINCRFVSHEMIEKLQEKVPEIDHHMLSAVDRRDEIMKRS